MNPSLEALSLASLPGKVPKTLPLFRPLQLRLALFKCHSNHSRFRINSFLPIGDTDSEIAFCALLERLKPLWHGHDSTPHLAARLDVVVEFAKDLGQIGLANFLYCDGELLFAHGHRRKQADGEFKPPGLYLLRRRCTTRGHSSEAAGISIAALDQEVVLVASVPLTAEAWEPIPQGEVVVISKGQVVAREAARAPTPIR